MKSDASALQHPAEDDCGRLPSEGVRTGLSLLLVVHLFVLFVAIASNFRPVSPLRAQLREVPLVRSYLQALHMDLAYNYHLTYAGPSDFDYRLIVDLDPALEAESLVLPDPQMNPLRRQRFYQLTRTMSQFLEDDAREGILPESVAAGLLAQLGVTSGTHRLRLQYNQPPPPPDSASFLRAQDAGYRTNYDASLVFLQGKMGLIRRAPAAEVAPVVNQP